MYIFWKHWIAIEIVIHSILSILNQLLSEIDNSRFKHPCFKIVHHQGLLSTHRENVWIVTPLVITYIIMKRLSAGGLGLSQSLLSLFFLSFGRWQKLGSKETDWAQWRARVAGTSLVGWERGLRNTILSLSLPVPRGCTLCQPYQHFPPKTLVIALVRVPLHCSDTFYSAWNTLEW